MGKAYTILFGQKLMTVLDCQQLCKAKTGKDLLLLFLLGLLWPHNRIEQETLRWIISAFNILILIAGYKDTRSY